MKLVCNNEPNKNTMVEMPLMTLVGSRKIVRLAYGVINFLWRKRSSPLDLLSLLQTSPIRYQTNYW
jgi:hypothetical protein